ncbi:hypothetical protein C7T35_38405 [Variovorax sp. WS11]|nr:hypothetical protein C7T35_38405 [Variovorax sp. WS11]
MDRLAGAVARERRAGHSLVAGDRSGGVTEKHHATLLRYVEAQGGKAEATIVGSAQRSALSAQRTTAELAGLVNGRTGKAWEHEDKYWVDETIGFAVGCCVVPAAIAAAEARGGGVSGSDLATAVALAIDMEIRLLRPLGLSFVPGRAVANAKFTFGTYGAAIAAAKIPGLGPDGFFDALGLAHCQASGNFQGQVEGRGVALQAGIAVRNGIAAARLAAMGMPGPKGSLTGSCGLYAMHYPSCTVNFQQIVDRLGEDYLNVHLGFKGYPCGVVAHPVIDAVLAVRKTLSGRSIEAIDVFGAPSLGIMASPIERKRAPANFIEAQFSIPWAAACAMRDGHYSIAHYDDAAISDPELRHLAGLVSIHMSDDMPVRHRLRGPEAIRAARVGGIGNAAKAERAVRALPAQFSVFNLDQHVDIKRVLRSPGNLALARHPRSEAPEGDPAARAS